MEFKNVYFQTWKSPLKKIKLQKLWKKSWKCYIHMFIYAEFEIIIIGFLKERPSKYIKAHIRSQNTP